MLENSNFYKSEQLFIATSFQIISLRRCAIKWMKYQQKTARSARLFIHVTFLHKSINNKKPNDLDHVQKFTQNGKNKFVSFCYVKHRETVYKLDVENKIKKFIKSFQDIFTILYIQFASPGIFYNSDVSIYELLD